MDEQAEMPSRRVPVHVHGVPMCLVQSTSLELWKSVYQTVFLILEAWKSVWRTRDCGDPCCIRENCKRLSDVKSLTTNTLYLFNFSLAWITRPAPRPIGSAIWSESPSQIGHQLSQKGKWCRGYIVVSGKFSLSKVLEFFVGLNIFSKISSSPVG